MNSFWKDVGKSAVLGLMLPGLVLSAAVRFSNASDEPEVTKQPEVSETAASPTVGVKIPVLARDQVVEMELEDYLVEVVLAEMPASFELEALKAQAVVARTYTLRACLGKSKHESAAVCTDYACCQAYRTEEDYLEKGGTQENLNKIRSAVTQTAGQVLTYDGALIEATYFSCSGGYTEDAVAVWGTDVPYLQAVESPGEENAAYYKDTVTFTAGEFRSALGADLPDDPSSWFGAVSNTAGGGVEKILIGGKEYKGTELRALLGLRSTSFQISADGDMITVTTKGYGHRVGMSQYGADAMAAAGSIYPEILEHYYQGTILETWSIDKEMGIG